MNTFTLAEITLNITDGPHSDCQNEADSGFYYLSAKNIQNGRLEYDTARQITEDDFWAAHQRTQFEVGDIAITNSGSIGKVALAPDDPRTHRTTFQKSVAIIKPDLMYVEPYYLAQYLTFLQPRFAYIATGSSLRNLLLRDLRRTQVALPSLTEQRRIAAVLRTWDVALSQVEALYDAAQTRRWGLMQRLLTGHANHGHIGDFLTLKRGFDLSQRVETGHIEVIASNGVIGRHDVAKVRGPGVITGRTGTIGAVIYAEEDFWPLNTTLYVADFKDNLPRYIYYVLEHLQLHQYRGGTSVPSLNRHEVHDIAVTFPAVDEQNAIVDVLQHTDAQLANVAAYRAALQRQKLGLMQHYFLQTSA